MKISILLALAVAGQSLLAVTPDRVASTYFHAWEFTSAIRSSTETVVRLNDDGTFETVYKASGNALNLAAPYTLFADDHLHDGTYVFSKIDDTRGSLVLNTDSGIVTFPLLFETATKGTVDRYPSTQSGFYFTPVSERDRVPLINISARGTVAPNKPLIVGFVVPGSETRLYLVRVSGPSLKEFGVESTWTDPDFKIYPPPATSVAWATLNGHYADWTVTPINEPYYKSRPVFERLFDVVGTWIPASTKEAAEILIAKPGAYTVVCTTGANDQGGECLVEVYAFP